MDLKFFLGLSSSICSVRIIRKKNNDFIEYNITLEKKEKIINMKL